MDWFLYDKGLRHERVKEEITLYNDVNKNNDINQLHSGNDTDSTNSVRTNKICYKFHYYVNIISKLSTLMLRSSSSLRY